MAWTSWTPAKPAKRIGTLSPVAVSCRKSGRFSPALRVMLRLAELGKGATWLQPGACVSVDVGTDSHAGWLRLAAADGGPVAVGKVGGGKTLDMVLVSLPGWSPLPTDGRQAEPVKWSVADDGAVQLQLPKWAVADVDPGGPAGGSGGGRQPAPPSPQAKPMPGGTAGLARPAAAPLRQRQDIRASAEVHPWNPAEALELSETMTTAMLARRYGLATNDMSQRLNHLLARGAPRPTKDRECLGCGNMFPSEGAGHRICADCKQGPDWKASNASGSLAGVELS